MSKKHHGSDSSRPLQTAQQPQPFRQNLCDIPLASTVSCHSTVLLHDLALKPVSCELFNSEVLSKGQEKTNVTD